MRTNHLFQTLLALALGILVSNQTQAQKHRTLPILGADFKELRISGTTAVTRTVMPTLVSSSDEAAPQAAPQITQVDNNTFNYFNNTNCYNTWIYVSELSKQAEELGQIERTLRKEALAKNGTEKAALLRSAEELLRQAELKLIQASEISGKLSLEQFKLNEKEYHKLAEFTHASDGILQKANDVNEAAKHEIKLAKELRQEAYAQPSNAAKLGTLNNAEEKETSALAKQTQAISILQQYASYMGSNLAEMMASK